MRRLFLSFGILLVSSAAMAKGHLALYSCQDDLTVQKVFMTFCSGCSSGTYIALENNYFVYVTEDSIRDIAMGDLSRAADRTIIGSFAKVPANVKTVIHLEQISKNASGDDQFSMTISMDGMAEKHWSSCAHAPSR